MSDDWTLILLPSKPHQAQTVLQSDHAPETVDVPDTAHAGMLVRYVQRLVLPGELAVFTELGSITRGLAAEETRTGPGVPYGSLVDERFGPREEGRRERFPRSV